MRAILLSLPELDEIARVIGFNLMCAHTVNRPGSRSGTNRYSMARSNASLPIQDDIGDVTFRTGEANVEKCFGSEIGT